jgi:hypothetical protein
MSKLALSFFLMIVVLLPLPAASHGQPVHNPVFNLQILASETKALWKIKRLKTLKASTRIEGIMGIDSEARSLLIAMTRLATDLP